MLQADPRLTGTIQNLLFRSLANPREWINKLFGIPPPLQNQNSGVVEDIFKNPYKNQYEDPRMAEFRTNQAPNTPSVGITPNAVPQPQSSTDQYSQSLQNMPNREDYAPSNWRKVGAAIAGFGSGRPLGMWGGVPVGWQSNPGAGREFLDRPYKQAVGDWALETESLGKLSNIDLAQDRESRLDERLDLDFARANETARANRHRENLATLRYNLDKWKAENPNGRLVAVRGGNVMLFNPQTGKATDTGVESGLLTDVDRITMQFDNANSIEEFRQQNRSALQEDAQAHQVGMQEDRQAGQIDLKTTPSPSSSGAATTPSAQRTATINRAMDLMNSNPTWREFFMTDAQGRPTGLMHPPDPEWDEVKLARYLEAKSALSGAGDIQLGGSTPSPNSAPKPDPLGIR